jgi:hypothetical protein
MKKELLSFIRDRWSVGKTTITISIPTLLAILSIISGRLDILWLTLYIFTIFFVGSNSLNILLAREKLSATAIASSGSTKKSVEKYPRLVPYAKIGLVISILLIPLFGFVSPFNQPVNIFFYGTPTPSPTITPTPAPSPIPTLTSTPRPLSDFLYYMIVLDASENMQEAFHGQSKWLVAQNILAEIIKGLNPDAKYGLVVVGGSDSSGIGNPCGDPSTSAISFSTRDTVWNYFTELQPKGGGSFYKAFTLAKTQLEGLSKDDIRTLIYITGAVDACETENEWTALENIVAIPDTTVGLFSQIIILEEDGFKSQTIAERLNNLSENVNAQAPQAIQDVQGGGVTIVNVIKNVNNYVSEAVAAREPVTLISTSTSTFTPKPGATTTTPAVTVVLPTSTFTPIPPPIIPPTSIPPTQTPSQTTTVCQSTRPYLNTASYGGTATIYSPAHCSTGHLPEYPIYTSGVYSGIPEGSVVWVLVYAQNGLYYPQSPNACAVPAPPPNQGGGSWNVDSYLGLQANPEPEWFDIVVVVTDQATSDFLSNWLDTGCPNNFSGIDRAVLSQMNITEKAFITVRTR